MKVKKGAGERVFEAANALLLVLISLVMLYPFWHELCLSFSSSTEATRGGVFLLPRQFTVEAYQLVMKNAFIWIMCWIIIPKNPWRSLARLLAICCAWVLL